MIYLIGVDHCRAQRKKRGEDMSDCQREFQSVVESAIQSIHPCLLAEEDHPDFLSQDGVDSILLKIATAHGIQDQHRFVDANQAERDEIGYRSQFGPDRVPLMAHEIMHHFPKREEFWLSKIQNALCENVLFVCGWGHVASLSALLTRKGVSYLVWANKIGAHPSDLEFYNEVSTHIKENPAKFNNPNCFCTR